MLYATIPYMREKLTSSFFSLFLLLAEGISVSSAQAVDDRRLASDPTELQRTWDDARVFLPASTNAPNTRMHGKDLLENTTDITGFPAVIHAHGCAGIDGASLEIGLFLSRAGYIAVQPDSFARQIKPISCDPSIPQGGLHRGVLAWRHEEIRFALKQLVETTNLDIGPVFLMGFSEGAIAVATIKDTNVAGRIIEGWTCHAGWPEYKGLNSNLGEPVLSLVADRDPWFRLPILQGNCGTYIKGKPNGKSVVFGEGSPLRAGHWLSYDTTVQKIILDFLASHR